MATAKRISAAPVEMVLLSQIDIGTRRREKVNGIAGLAKSIEAGGLLHPIILTDGDVLGAGRRRMAAVEKLGWKTIPARRFPGLTEDQLRKLEIDENLQRDDLTAFEVSKERTRQIKAEFEAAKEVSRTEYAKPSPKGGRPQGGNRAAARKLGLSEGAIRKTRKHVSVAEEFPALQGSDWSQKQVLDASKRLDEIGEDHRQTVGDMISEPLTSSDMAVEMLVNVAKMPTAERKAMAKLYETGDKGKKGIARARARKAPPPLPDHLQLAISMLIDARKLVKITPKVDRVLAENVHLAVQDMRDAVSRKYQAFKEKEQGR